MRRLSLRPCLLSGLFFVLSLLSVHAQQNSLPVALTGFNRDVVFENRSKTSAIVFDDQATAWIEDGLQKYAGLPSHLFASRIPNVITRGKTLYQLQPFKANNVLLLTSENAQATLTLIKPACFRSLSIAAASSNARFVSGVGTLILNFEDGSASPPISYNAQDWWGEGANNNPSRIFEAGVFRSENVGVNLLAQDVHVDVAYQHFNLYETPLDLSNINGADYTGHKLKSITFNLVPGAFHTGIFAVSGVTISPGFNVYFENLKNGSIYSWQLGGLNGTVLTDKGFVFTANHLDWRPVILTDLNGDDAPDLLFQHK